MVRKRARSESGEALYSEIVLRSINIQLYRAVKESNNFCTSSHLMREKSPTSRNRPLNRYADMTALSAPQVIPRFGTKTTHVLLHIATPKTNVSQPPVASHFWNLQKAFMTLPR